jgi:hypothetical protein
MLFSLWASFVREIRILLTGNTLLLPRTDTPLSTRLHGAYLTQINAPSRHRALGIGNALRRSRNLTS